jgi:hypothetical protein
MSGYCRFEFKGKALMIGALHLSLLDGRFESNDTEKLAFDNVDEGDPQHPIAC